MNCQQCLEENKRSIKENGYGYGYIGKSFNCERHKSNTSQKQNNATLKWTDGQPDDTYSGVVVAATAYWIKADATINEINFMMGKSCRGTYRRVIDLRNKKQED